MDPPLEPPLRVVFKEKPVAVEMEEAQLVIQRFITDSKSTAWGESDGNTQDGLRGTSSIVLGQLQRLSDSLEKDANRQL